MQSRDDRRPRSAYRLAAADDASAGAQFGYPITISHGVEIIGAVSDSECGHEASAASADWNSDELFDFIGVQGFLSDHASGCSVYYHQFWVSTEQRLQGAQSK